MAELPEIAKYSAQMNETLRGKTIASVTILQEKCVNVPVAEFDARVAGAAVTRVYYRGKWIILELTNGESLLLNVGMGADVLFAEAGAADPEKYQIKVSFVDGTGFTARFLWIGKLLLMPTAELATEPAIKDVALDPFNPAFTPEYFANLLAGKRTGVKSFIINQKQIGGIGNMYAHDILFVARLHPLTKISEMSEAQVRGLYDAIQQVLGESRDKGTFAWEKDFFGEVGGWGGEDSGDFRVGYREGEPCPECGAAIVQIKTGSNSGYLCPVCQPA